LVVDFGLEELVDMLIDFLSHRVIHY